MRSGSTLKSTASPSARRLPRGPTGMRPFCACLTFQMR